MSSKKSSGKKEMKVKAPKTQPGPRNQLLSSAYLRDYASMMTNPKDSQPVRSPSEFAMVGDIKTFTRVFPLTAANSISNNFAMVVTPAIENFFQLTRAVGITSPNAMDAADPQALVFAINSLTGLIEANGTFTVTDAVSQVPLGAAETTLFNGKMSIRVNTPPLGDVNYTINNAAVGCTYTLYYWDPVLLIWVLGATQPLAAYQQGSIGLVPVNGVGALCLQCSRGATKTTASVSVPIGSAFDAQAQSYDLFNSDAVQLAGVERYRITALSILVSFSGNQFNDGGVVAAARTQPGFIFGDDPYTSLTRLLDHQYHGPLKTGAYVWWLPNSYSEREYTPLGVAPPASTSLRVAGSFSDPDGSLQITITTVVEFYSRLQIFNHELGVPVDDQFYHMLHALDSVPASTCNPLHKDLLKLVLKGAKHAVEFARQNPAVVAAALKSIASML